MKIVIATEVQSLNKILRQHWAKRGRMRMDIEREIWAASGLAFPYKRRKKVRTVTITSFRKRLLDRDNLAGGAKIHVDALKACGLIFDDGPDWIELHVNQYRDLRNPRTEIEVTE